MSMKSRTASESNGLGLDALYEEIFNHQIQWMLADVIIQKKSSSVDHRNITSRGIKRWHLVRRRSK